MQILVTVVGSGLFRGKGESKFLLDLRCIVCSNNAVDMEDSAVEAATTERRVAENGVKEGEGAVSGAVGNENASTGDNSLTSCEDNVSTIGDADDIANLEHYHRIASSSAVSTHPASFAPGALASGLPTSLHLCKVHAHCLVIRNTVI